MKKKIKFLTYNECKKWVQENLSAKGILIKTWKDWDREKYDLPDFIPMKPKSFYLKVGGWISWNDFLGIHGVESNFINYKEAKRWVDNNIDLIKINTIHKWRSNTWQLPDFIPKAPDKFYKVTGWIDWNEWLEKKS